MPGRDFRRFDSRLDRWDKIISTMTTKIANILQCYALGMGIKQISRSFELSRNTVRRYVRLFQVWYTDKGVGRHAFRSHPGNVL